jgi:hypothetical protein
VKTVRLFDGRGLYLEIAPSVIAVFGFDPQWSFSSNRPDLRSSPGVLKK